MERKIAALFLFAFVCLQFALSPSSVSAQVDGGVLDLKQIIEEALGNNPELNGAQAKADAFRERPAQVASLEDPRISLRVSRMVWARGIEDRYHLSTRRW